MNLILKVGRGIGWLLSKIVMVVLAIVVIGPYEGTKWLYKRVYKEWLDYIGFTLFGLTTSVYSAISAYDFVHSIGHGVLASGVAGFVGFLLVAAAVAPVLWMLVLRWVVKLFDKLWRAINDVARKNFESLAASLLEVCRYLPGSNGAWTKVLAPDRKSFLLNVLKVIAYPTSVAGSAYVGYTISHWVAALCAGVPILAGAAVGAGAVVGALVFALLADIACKWLHYGKTPALALLLSFGAIAGAVPFVGSFLALSLTTTAIGSAVAYVLAVAYVFPYAVVFLSDRFMNWVLTTLKPLLTSAYDEKESGSRQMFQQLTNLVVTGLAGWGTYWLCAAIALPFAVSLLAVFVVVALTYTLAGKALDWDGGNFVIGGTLAVGTGVAAGFSWAHFGFAYSNFGAVIAGVLAALPVFFLVFPLFYVGYRWLSTRVTINGAVTAIGEALSAAHDKVWKRFDKLIDKCQKVYRFAYRDERPYDKLVLQITNLLVTAAVGFGLHGLLQGFAVGHLQLLQGFLSGYPSLLHGIAAHPWLLHGLATGHPWLAITATAIGTAITYIAVGQYIVKTGLELVGATVSLVAAVILGSIVSGAQPLGLLFAVPFGIVVAALTYALVYPLAFIGVRWIADPLFTGWLLPILDGIHQWAWNTFFTVFKAVRDFLAPIFSFLFGWLKPAWDMIAGLFVGAWKMAMSAWNSMFGSK
jgi:hypothetical protein